MPSHVGYAAEVEPTWIRDLLAFWAAEVRLFLHTLGQFVRAPHAFGADWAEGRLRVINPAAFLAATWPLLLPADYGLQHLLGWDHRRNVGLGIEVARALKPYLLVVPASLLIHAALRLGGSRRRLSSTLAMMLYGVALVALGWVIGLGACYLFKAPRAIIFVISGAAAMWTALALAGLHRVRWPLCAALYMAAWFASAHVVNWVLDRARLS
jgi:hypothetical protein